MVRPVIIFFLASSLSAISATINVSNYGDGSASWANVSNALHAATTGDTVLFPLNGAANWGQELLLNKAVTIDGNGSKLSTSVALNSGFLFIYGLSTSSLLRITSLSFSNAGFTGYALRGYNNTITSLRVDHCNFTNGSYQVDIAGWQGVIDHCYFVNGSSAILFTGGSRSQADASWTTVAPATSACQFFEDNTMLITSTVVGVYAQVVDCDSGGKLVFRNNVIDVTGDSKTGGSQQFIFQNHGNACGGCDSVNKGYWQNDATARRSPSVVEFYSNSISGNTLGRFATFRGGSILCYSNKATSVTYTPTIVLYEEEDDLVSQFSPSRTAWPAEDQVHNSFFWSNTSNGGDPGLTVLDPTFIQEDRDYWLHAPAATGGKESFTGLNGGSATAPTDGITYPTLGNMTFSASGANAYYPYTPYQYPHPLQGVDTTTTHNILNLRIQ
jgi:hypothetical protein